MDQIPAEIWSAVKDNVVVQWFLVVVFILLLGTNTAEKLKGPIGGLIRSIRGFGTQRDERESKERAIKRARARDEWAGEREDWERRLVTVENRLREEIALRTAEQEARSETRRLIEQHLVWDYDRVEELISMGQENIPPAPPLRVIQVDGGLRAEPSTNPGLRRLGPGDPPKPALS